MKYDVLVKILDQIRKEASSAYRKKYLKKNKKRNK